LVLLLEKEDERKNKITNEKERKKTKKGF